MDKFNWRQEISPQPRWRIVARVGASARGMLSYWHMTTLLDKALRQVKTLPIERQDDYGQVLMTMLEQDTSELQLDAAQIEEIERRLTNPERAVSEADAMTFIKTLM